MIAQKFNYAVIEDDTAIAKAGEPGGCLYTDSPHLESVELPCIAEIEGQSSSAQPMSETKDPKTLSETHGLLYKLFHMNEHELANLPLSTAEQVPVDEPVNIPTSVRLRALAYHFFCSQESRDVFKSVLAYFIAVLFCFHKTWSLPLFGTAPVQYVTLFATCFIITPPGNAAVGVQITKTIIILLTMAVTTAVVFLLVYWLNDHGVYLICVIAITAWLLGLYRYLFPDQVSEAAAIGFTFANWMFLDAAQSSSGGWHPELLLSLWAIYSCGLFICLFINLLVFPKLSSFEIEADLEVAIKELFDGLDSVTHTFIYVCTTRDDALESSSSLDAVDFQLQTAAEKLAKLTTAIDNLKYEFNVTHFDDQVSESILFSAKRLQRHLASMSASLRMIASFPTRERQHLGSIVSSVKPALFLLVEALKEDLLYINKELHRSSSNSVSWLGQLWEHFRRLFLSPKLSEETSRANQKLNATPTESPAPKIQKSCASLAVATEGVRQRTQPDSPLETLQKERKDYGEDSGHAETACNNRHSSNKRRSTYFILPSGLSPSFDSSQSIVDGTVPATPDKLEANAKEIKKMVSVPNGFHDVSYLDLHSMLNQNSHLIPNVAAISKMSPSTSKYRLILNSALQNFDHAHKQAVVQVMKQHIGPKWRASESFLSSSTASSYNSHSSSIGGTPLQSPALSYANNYKRALHNELASRFLSKHSSAGAVASSPLNSPVNASAGGNLGVMPNKSSISLSQTSKLSSIAMMSPMLETIDSAPGLFAEQDSEWEGSSSKASTSAQPFAVTKNSDGVLQQGTRVHSSVMPAKIEASSELRDVPLSMNNSANLDRVDQAKDLGSKDTFISGASFSSSVNSGALKSAATGAPITGTSWDVTGFESMMTVFYFFFGIREFTKETSIMGQRVDRRKAQLHLLAPWFYKTMSVLGSAFCIPNLRKKLRGYFRKKPKISNLYRSSTTDSVTSASSSWWTVGYTDLLIKDLAEENELFRSFKKLRASLNAKLFQRPREGGLQNQATSRARFIVHSVFQFCKGPQFVYASKLALSMSLFSLLLVSQRTREWAFHYHLEWALASIAITTSPIVGSGTVNHLWRIGGSVVGGIWAVVTWFLCETNFGAACTFLLGLSITIFYVHLHSASFRLFAIITLSSFTSIYFAAVRNYSEEESNINIMETLLMKTLTICLAVAYGMLFTSFIWPTYAGTECREELAHTLNDLSLLLRKNHKLLICQTCSSLKTSVDFEEQAERSNVAPVKPASPITAISSITVYSNIPDIVHEKLVNGDQWHMDVQPSNGAPSVDEFLVLEFKIQHCLFQIRKMIAMAVNEPRVLGPFPKDSYEQLCRSCQLVLDRLLTFRMAASKETSPAFKTYIFPVLRENADQLVKIILEHLYMFSGALMLKKPLPPLRNSGEQATDALLNALFSIPSNLERTILNGDLHYVFVYFGLKDIMQELLVMRETLVQLFGQMRMVV